jgi:Methane/Phenol/Toluene Hydroxylase
MRNLIEAHNRAKDFDWETSYVEKPVWYPTKYEIPAKTKDPFRHLVRDYLSMEEEKDNRQYGSMEDALARGQASSKAEPRWMEIMKAVLPIINFGEYAAMKSTGQRSIPSPTRNSARAISHRCSTKYGTRIRKPTSRVTSRDTPLIPKASRRDSS